MAKHTSADAISLYREALLAEKKSPRLALNFYRKADRKNTRICLDVFLVAMVTPLIGALIIDQVFSFVRPFWEGIVFALISIFPAIILAFFRGFGPEKKSASQTFWTSILGAVLYVYIDFMTAGLILISTIVGMILLLLPVSLVISLFTGMPFLQVATLLPQFITYPVFYIMLYLSLVKWFTNVPLSPLYGIRRIIIDGIAGLLTAWADLMGLAARFFLVWLAIASPQFNHYEFLVNSVVAGFLLGASLYRIKIDKVLSVLITLGNLRVHYLLDRNWSIYHILTTLIKDTKDDKVGIKYLVWALAHQKVLYEWQISPPHDKELGCFGSLIKSALNSGITMLPYFKESPDDILNEARNSGSYSQELSEVWDQTVKCTHEVMKEVMGERIKRERQLGRVVKQL